MAVFCLQCEKLFATQSSLNRHRLEVHNLKSSVVSYDPTNSGYKNFICGEDNCNSAFINSQNLREHLSEVHNIEKSSVKEMEFLSMEEFETWFKQEQRSTVTNFYLKTTLKAQMDETSYFYCNRSGKIPMKQDFLKKRSTKSQGSCKINKCCTSQIILKRNVQTNKCSIRYFYKHYGHEIEVQHVRIPKVDRESIASKLILGVSVSNLLNTSRNAVCIEDKLNRVDLLLRKDINNIKSAYNISINDGCRHKDDATSVHLFVSECSKSDLNPVVYYKPQGKLCREFNLEEKDFCIILLTESQQHVLKTFGNNIISIDGTHGLNSYNFEMTTVMVIDEFGEGFPVACMYSNRKDTYIYQVFFSKIREIAGEIKAKVFMSDIAPAFYNAWCIIMGPVQYHLLCAWHVDRCWQINLNKIVDKDQRQMVYKTLKYIQYLLDESEFEKELEIFLKYLSNINSLADFRNYFLNNYFPIKTQWAYTYRKHCNVNTNMHLESMHRALKYFYFDGKKIKRLDKSIHMLLKFVRDKTVERLIKLTKGKTTNYLTKIHSRHRAALTAVDYKLESHTSNEGIVKNINTNERYTIKIEAEKVCCQVKCTFCHICIHSCSCSCIDFVIRATLCKHIHFFILNSKQTTVNLDALQINHDVQANVKTLIKSIDTKKFSELKEEVEVGALKIVDKIKNDNYSYEQVNLVAKHLRIANSVDSLSEEIPTKMLKQNKETLYEPSNKKITKQVSFFSTKNKSKKSEKIFKKPNYKEKLALKGNMNDHLY